MSRHRPEDRAEDEAPDEAATVVSRADGDARWVKNGRKSTLGYKGFARTDEDGFIDKIHVTPANVGESPQFGTMIDGAWAMLRGTPRRHLAKGGAGPSAAGVGKALKPIDFKMPLPGGAGVWHDETAVWPAPGTVFWVVRVHAHMVMAAISQNPLKAANKITLNKQTLTTR
jgi:IS5 family transposase